MKSFAIVVAATASTFGIGKNGSLPWRIVEDMNFFKQVTTSSTVENKINAVVMGRKTYESIPEKYRPLKDRLNVIISHNENLREVLKLPDEVIVASSLVNALEQVTLNASVDKVFVIGGESIYREAVELKECSKILLTAIENEVECDTYFPFIRADKYRLIYKSPLKSDEKYSYRFTEYENLFTQEQICTTIPSLCVNSEEMNYLNLVRDIIETGSVKSDRTGTGTISKFGVQMRFNLRNNVFPLLTTKRVFWRGVAEELLWFIKGSTNANELAEKNIHIWNDNGSVEFLSKLGLGHRQVGDLGPVYGFQWRHFGAPYKDMNADYTGQGIDQLKECIHKLKTNPDDRRIVLTAWNPADLKLMALPPCHMFCQFYVSNGELSCQMYQRSADMGLGVPFNIASYSLLTRLVAQVCGLKAGDFIHCIGDAHVYLNHVEALKEQLQRIPKAFPTLKINPEVQDIDSFQFSDFTIEGYNPDATIKMKMAV